VIVVSTHGEIRSACVTRYKGAFGVVRLANLAV